VTSLRTIVVAGFLSGAVALTGACSPADASPRAGAASIELTVFAAASLRDVVGELKAMYESATPGVRILLSSDSSAALATRIDHGAPADVFLSADTANPQRLVAAGLADGDPVVFASNQLAVIVPAGNPANISTPLDLARPGVKIIAAGDQVPITGYARQLVDALVGSAGYPAGFAAAYDTNVVSREDNVKAVVAKIELGEGDAAIAYATDVVASGRVDRVGIPADAVVVAHHAAVLVRGSKHREAAHEFLAWLAGPEGEAILRSFGFMPPDR
jgi:molybdate transport system substrate-binding protein